MPTDIRLDEVDGTWVIVESAALKSTASDFLLDAPGRRSASGGFRRALVHDGRDGLTLNFNGDYPGGVTVGGDLRVTGRLLLSADASSGISRPRIHSTTGSFSAGSPGYGTAGRSPGTRPQAARPP